MSFWRARICCEFLVADSFLVKREHMASFNFQIGLEIIARVRGNSDLRESRMLIFQELRLAYMLI